MSNPLDEFPLSIAAYVADTQHLSTVQHGAYLLILMTMRRAGGWIPDDDRQLAKIARMTLDKWRKIASEIRQLMVCKDGKIGQKRVLADLEKQTLRREKNRDCGRAGGIAKSLKSKDATLANATVSPDVRQPSARNNDVNAIPSLFKEDSEQKIPKKERNSCGRSLPSDWVPSEVDLAYAAKLSLTAPEVDACAEDMRLWAKANANRAVGRKADWTSTFHGWLRREAPKIIRQRSFNVGGSNGANRNGSAPRLGAAGLAAEIRRRNGSGISRADGPPAFDGFAGADESGGRHRHPGSDMESVEGEWSPAAVATTPRG